MARSTLTFACAFVALIAAQALPVAANNVEKAAEGATAKKIDHEVKAPRDDAAKKPAEEPSAEIYSAHAKAKLAEEAGAPVAFSVDSTINTGIVCLAGCN